MKRKIAYLTITAALCTGCFFIGKNCATPTQHTENINTMTESTHNPDYLDLNTVIGFDATEVGLMLYTQDGSGYYLEK